MIHETGTIMFFNRTYIWLFVRSRRWKYKPKRARTRADKTWAKHHIRVQRLARQRLEPLEVGFGELKFSGVPILAGFEDAHVYKDGEKPDDRWEARPNK